MRRVERSTCAARPLLFLPLLGFAFHPETVSSRLKLPLIGASSLTSGSQVFACPMMTDRPAGRRKAGSLENVSTTS